MSAWPERWRFDNGYLALYQKLAIQHGHERAQAIAAGKDDATNRDMAAWRGLGTPVQPVYANRRR